MEDKLIKFDGVWLEDIAPDVKIDDVQVSPIIYNPLSSDRPLKYGAQFIRNTGGTRNVVVTFAVLTDDRESREEQLQAIRDWAITDRECKLFVPHFANRYLECVCIEHPDTSYRQWWQNRLRLVFTCYNNPFWNSDEQQVYQCGIPFSVNGSAPPLMTIERRTYATLVSQTYIKDNKVIRLSEIPAGTLVIDLNTQLVTVSGVSIMQNVLPTSEFFEPVTGANQVINGSGNVKVRERWV